MVHRSPQQRGRQVFALAVVVTALGLSGCAKLPDVALGSSDEKVSKVEQIGTSDLHTVTLSEVAATRLGIATDVVKDAPVRGQVRRVLPYAAVVYDAEGATYAFQTSEPRVFARVLLTVDFVEGELAVLTAGPPAGTSVVTVGVAELLGTEYGVGGE